MYNKMFRICIGVALSCVFSALFAAVVGTGSPASCTPAALQNAVNAGGTVTFNCGAATHVITLQSEITVPANTVLTIDGGNRIILDGNLATRLISTGNGRLAGNGQPDPTGLHLSLRNLTLRKGQGAGPGGAIHGGNFILLTVDNVRFENNDGTAGGERGGGAIAVASRSQITVRNSVFENNRGINGGAINTLLSPLLVENSRFIGNDSTPEAGGTTTSGYGGAIYTDGASNHPDSASAGDIIIRDSHFQGNRGAGQGGAAFLYVYPPDRVQVERSSFHDNEVLSNASNDALGGALRHGNGQLTLLDSTFTDNRAGSQGGGLWIGEGSSATLRNLTFHGNTAGSQGGAIMLASSGTTSLRHLTLTDNQADVQGGAMAGNLASASLDNSVIAFNRSGDSLGRFQHCTARAGAGGGNLQFPGRQAFLADDVDCAAGVQVADPLLVPLGDYGGTTLTRVPAGNSPALSIAGPGACSGTDQRGLSRSQGPGCDAGAAEYQPGESLPDPRNPVVLGSGGMAACNEAGLDAALLVSQSITFNCPAGTVITLTGEKQVYSNLELDGNGVILDGGGATRLWRVASGYGAAFRELTLRNGRHNDCGGGVYTRGGRVTLDEITLGGHRAMRGGALCNEYGQITVTDSEIRDNTCTGSDDVGCGIFNHAGSVSLQGTTLRNNQAALGRGGAVANRSANGIAGRVDIGNSRLIDNRARDGGAASTWQNDSPIHIVASTLTGNQATGNGGALYANNARLDIRESLLDNNSAARGGAITGFGGELLMARSTVSNNRASNSQFGAGGIDMGSGSLRLVNSTLHGNQAYQPGALYAGDSVAVLIHVTLTDNVASNYMSGVQSNGGLRIRNSILANPGGNCVNGIDEGGNLQSTSSDCAGIPVGDPRLDALTDNGGATPTRLPAADSGAVDRGDARHCEIVDQRGFGRGDSGCDSGAVEQGASRRAGLIFRDGFD